jgi:exonuclease III
LSSEDLKHQFLNNPYTKYKFFFNSSKNKRGVGILIKNDLQIEILEQRNSECENVIALHIRLAGTEILLVSIYGPNSNDPEFFNFLTNLYANFSNIPVVCGGDWNCLFSTNNIESNIDCINMNRLPNANHSARLKILCDTFNLTDPFRFLYPDLVDFSYVPRNNLQLNRSRLDFFIISDSLLPGLSDCSISPGFQNKLFDHKAVKMIFNQKNLPVPGRPTISNKELNDELLDFLIHEVTAETYLIHTGVVFINGINKDLILNSCGIIRRLIRDCGPPLHLRTGTTIKEEDQTARDRLLVRIQVLLGSLNMQVIESVPLNVGADIFMETLLNNLKNETISHQSFMRKIKNEKIIDLKKSLYNLKTNYAEKVDDILSQENALNSILDLEMRAELEKFRHYDILNTEKITPRFLSLTKITEKLYL